jgi:15-cis-phytoene synthase
MTAELCAAQVARADPDRFATAMTAPMPRRGDLMVLYAFNLEVARAPWVTSEPMLAEMRLQWWRDAIAEIYEGGSPRRHEVVTPLAEIIARADLPRAAFETLIDARRWDIEGARPTDPDQTWAYVDATAGALMALAARALGAGPAALAVVHDAARGQGAAALLLARPALEAAGKPPLPEGDQAVADFATQALGHLARARAQRRLVGKAVAPALRPSVFAAPVLRQAARPPGSPIEMPSPARRKAALALATLRGRW